MNAKHAYGRLAMTFLILGLFVSPVGAKEARKMAQQRSELKVTGFKLVSSSFENGKPLPSRSAYAGGNFSPQLKWGEPPERTKSFVLIVDDPDAPRGDWVHWVLFNIPPQLRELKEGISDEELKKLGAVEGLTDFGRAGYGGPAPPSGTHRYFFKLYALDTTLPLSASATKADLIAVMEGHILSETQLMGTYQRK